MSSPTQALLALLADFAEHERARAYDQEVTPFYSVDLDNVATQGTLRACLTTAITATLTSTGHYIMQFFCRSKARRYVNKDGYARSMV